jgi:hypothetical protein
MGVRFVGKFGVTVAEGRNRICGGALPVVAAPLFHDQDGKAAAVSDQDYSKNKTYQQGMREDQADKAHSKDHSKNKHFKRDDDQKAYDATRGAAIDVTILRGVLAKISRA